MRKKLTITVDSEIYDGLYRVAGARHISSFISDLVRPLVVEDEIETGFRALAQYERETGLDQEAIDWSEGLLESLDDDEG